MRYVARKLESRCQYTITVVSDNFPRPTSLNKKQHERVEEAAERVLKARETHPESGSTLSDLYDPLTMPSELVRAHQALDRAVDLTYRPQKFTVEANRVAFLFDRYKEITHALLSE